MPTNDPRFLQARAAEVRAAVLAELTGCPASLKFDTYVARGPVLTVSATSTSGASSTRDFDFKPLDELHTLRLANSIVRFLLETSSEVESVNPGANSHHP